MEDLKLIEWLCNEAQKKLYENRMNSEEINHKKEVQLLFDCVEKIRALCAEKHNKTNS